jgi:hypothetical protein
MRSFLLTGLILLGLATAPAMAADANPPNEIVYRANLGRADDIKLLLKEGANANQTDEKGTPLLCLASGRTDDEAVHVVEALLDAGANIDAKDRAGQNALFYAARRGNSKVVQKLLERKINYYAVDNNGDIARTIAFREGHSDIVGQMDDFVKGETVKITEQYRELEKRLAEQYKAQEEASQKASAEATRDALEANRKNHDEAQAKKDEIKKQSDKEKQAAQDLADRRNSDDYAQDSYDLMFNACAFEYWSFCKNMNQTSELKDSELDNAIRSHKDQVLAISEDMAELYALRKKQAERMINDSKTSIFALLSSMPSKTYRFEHGVCKMKDMITRCEDIAENGGQSSEPPMAQPAKDKGKIGTGVMDRGATLEKGRAGGKSGGKKNNKNKKHR